MAAGCVAPRPEQAAGSNNEPLRRDQTTARRRVMVDCKLSRDATRIHPYAHPVADKPLRQQLAAPGPIDLRRTMANGHGPGDPSSWREKSGAFWRASRNEMGPASVRVAPNLGGFDVLAWGAGAERALELVPQWLGFDDDPDALVPVDPVVARAKKAHPGLRLGRGRCIFEVLVPMIIGQRVTAGEAATSWRQLVYAHGEPAPGPQKLRVPPTPEALKRVPLHAFHQWGLEGARARIILDVCHHERFVRSATDRPANEAVRQLRKLPGIGPWTANLTIAATMGWPDALPLGDYHFPSVVAHAFTGEENADDRRMVELLEPYRGQRWRVMRLVGVDTKHAPRRHHRRAPWKVQVELATRRRSRS
jgi:3-methyladenine DNA glycosylase/8-oxoguanine DNA glycosylase